VGTKKSGSTQTVSIEKTSKKDLAKIGDCIWAVANSVNIEEHFLGSFLETKEDRFFDLYTQTRKHRAELLKLLIQAIRGKREMPEGEIWCCSKHILGTFYRLLEVAGKTDNPDERKKYADIANRMRELLFQMLGG